jgi:hypothetical protein
VITGLSARLAAKVSNVTEKSNGGEDRAQTIGCPASTIGAIAMNSSVEDGMLIAAPGSGGV